MPEPTSLEFDERVYSVEAVQKAAYRFMNTFVADISVRGGTIHCVLEPTGEMPTSDLARELQDFKKEVLDQHLRLKLKTETEPIRNLILGIAFSKTGLQESE